jgi:soluble lytic murein transglycosylase
MLACAIAALLAFVIAAPAKSATPSAENPAAHKSHKHTSAKAKTAKAGKHVRKASSKHKKTHAAAKPKHKLAVVSSTVLSKADVAALTDAFNEADRKNWPEAMRHAKRLTDPVAAKLVLWSRLVAQDSGATLAEIVAFQEQNPDWPRQALLTRRAEEALLAYPMSDSDVVKWFDAHPPVTGEGKIKYGQALIATGRGEDGKSWIQRAWVEDDFAPARQKEILANYRSYLTIATHRARLDRLLWDRRTSDAKLTAALIGADAQALADARIKLMSGSNEASGALSRVPSSLKDNPGLIFDQVRYERRRGNDEATVPLILTAPNKPHAVVDLDAWWIERKIAARVALSSGEYKEAYRIVSRHGLTSGSDFAEAEFMSGWIALQYLNNASAALAHFAKLNDAVSTPISKARAEYWCGRAASAQGDRKVAELYYRKAAAYPTTFYGQLGAAALASLSGSDARLHLASDPKPTTAARATFEKLELVHAVHILHDFERTDQMWSFMLHLADVLEEPDQVAELADLAIRFDEPKLSLRIAKAAAQRNIVLAQRAYPTSFMPRFAERGPAVEKALVYGLSRQESEFDAGVISPAGARGLMQLMPATAKHVARQISVPYSPSRLTSDPAYNAMLGSAHLGDLIDNYTGSYIMSIAAYNAGATHVGEWAEQFGDPRSSAVDPVDWIENIPFSETRNYVQRVMENLEVYRTRLSGTPQRIQISNDLRRNTGAPITAAAPVPGKIPLASPLVPASAMAPVVEEDEEKDADTSPKDAPKLADAKETPAVLRTPLEPVRRKGGKQ